jgi:hypothetical protein
MPASWQWLVGSSGGSMSASTASVTHSRAKRWGGPLALRLTTLPLFANLVAAAGTRGPHLLLRA